MRNTIKLLVLLIITRTSLAQQFSVADYRSDLNIKIEVIDEKRIDKGIEILNGAAIIEAEALGILESVDDSDKMAGLSPEYKKAIKKFSQASEHYKEGHTLIYTVFVENCDKFFENMRKMNHYASGMQKAKYYEQKGENTYEKSLRIRNILLEADKPEWIQYKMHEALELEKLAIRDKGRALQIYQDFPVEYNYGWVDDVTAEELAKIFKNPVVNVPPEEVFKKKPVEIVIPPEEEVIFRVQIAAHTVQLNPEYIKTFYTGKDSVIEKREGKWYKYQIGQFDTFAEAGKLQKTCRVPRAFIVAYQNNIKLSIKQALAIQKATNRQ